MPWRYCASASCDSDSEQRLPSADASCEPPLSIPMLGDVKSYNLASSSICAILSYPQLWLISLWPFLSAEVPLSLFCDAAHGRLYPASPLTFPLRLTPLYIMPTRHVSLFALLLTAIAVVAELGPADKTHPQSRFIRQQRAPAATAVANSSMSIVCTPSECLEGQHSLAGALQPTALLSFSAHLLVDSWCRNVNTVQPKHRISHTSPWNLHAKFACSTRQ